MDWTGKVRSDAVSGNMLFNAVIACAMAAGVRVGGEEELSKMLVLRCSSIKGSGGRARATKESGNKNFGGKPREGNGLRFRHMIFHKSAVENDIYS